MKIETWKPVHLFEGFYEVSDLGNVRRIAPTGKISMAVLQKMRKMRKAGEYFRVIAERFDVTKAAVIKALSYRYKRTPLRLPYRVLMPQTSTHGYSQVSLCKNGKRKVYMVHILVAQVFLGPRPATMEVNHKNGMKKDPSLRNLEYISHRANTFHAHRVLHS